MRIIGWNANYNNRRRSLEADVALLKAEEADLIVLSETARPNAEVAGRVVWLGTAVPGLAVIAGNGYTVSACDRNTNAPPLFGGFHVRGPSSLDLLAAWPVKAPGWSYARLLHESLEVFADFLSTERVALIGDLNSSSRVKAQSKSHPAFVERAARLGLVSIYHHQMMEGHGEETVSTYRRGGTGGGLFHIDYCFVSKALLGSASIRVLNGPKWDGLSDHAPIVVEI